ncbi:MAG TPA: hypothetical protein VFX70_03180, partial [Mycobacteriales bacterium]|nr:hypothetical protein [Mycobacteriales bacterium]
QGWALFQSGRGVPGWVNPIAGVNGRPVIHWPFDELLSTSLTGFHVTSGYFLPKSINGWAVLLWARALGVAVPAAPLAVLVAWPRRSAFWMSGAVTLGGLVAYPLVVEAQIYLDSRLYFPALSPRYGLSLVPCVLACVVLVAWKRGARRTLLVATGVGCVAILATVGGLLA